MNRMLIVVLGIVLVTVPTYAAPFVKSDPQPGVTHYRVASIPAWLPGTVPAEPTGEIKMDVGAAPDGLTKAAVTPCVAPTTAWPAERCATAATPLDFTPTPRPATTSGIGLIP
jgi:hypothetical protein